MGSTRRIRAICDHCAGLALLCATLMSPSAAIAQSTPQEVYEKNCATCHATGKEGAPRLDDKAAWKARMKDGFSGIFDSTLRGKGNMPPKGGNPSLSDDAAIAATTFILGTAGVIPFVPTTIGGQPSAPPSASPASATTTTAAKSTGGNNDAGKGRGVYQSVCAVCHAGGVAGAPRLGDAAAWNPRIKSGVAALYTSALRGKAAMPAKGGNTALGDADVKAAVDFMLAQVRAGGAPSAAAVATVASAVTAAPAKKPSTTTAAPAGDNTAATGDSGKGKSIYQGSCAACHASGLAGAPKFGDAAQWAPRIKSGAETLYASALRGKGAMPAKGGNIALADADVKAAVDFLMAQAGAPVVAASGNKVALSAKASEVPTPGAAMIPATPIAPLAIAGVAAPTTASDVNAFNRLLRAPGKRNLPPAEDNIHDPDNDGTHTLQAPLQAFANLPKGLGGNQVDWVKGLREKKFSPRADRSDDKAEMAVLDLNIVREVKGSMPDVVYPHKQHTEILDCANCHPAIFIPHKGANQISMASILLGQKCGVCHGKVAFPVSECRRCHSKSKDPMTAGGKP